MLTVDRRLIQHFDWMLFGLVALLLAMGIVNLHSASSVSVGFSDEVRRQLMSLAVGAALGALAVVVDYRHLDRLAYPIFFLSLLPEQLRPQIVHRWRQRVRQLAVSGHTVFGPWHDLVRATLAVPGVKPATNARIPAGQVTSLAASWKKQKIDPRVITALVEANPGTLAELAEAYGTRSFLVGDRFSRADLAAASLFAPLFQPAQYPVPWPKPNRIPKDIKQWLDQWQPQLQVLERLYQANR